MASEERLRELEEKYEDYKVYDNRGDRIGKVDDLFVDETDREEYIGVKLGLLGMRSTLIPMDIVRVNEADRTIEVSDTKAHVKDAPSFDDDEDITGEYERRIRDYFGLEAVESSSSRGSYGASSEGNGDAAGGATGTAAGATAGEREHDRDRDDEPEDSTTAAEHPTDDREHADTEHSDEQKGSASEGGSHSIPEYEGSGESHESGEHRDHEGHEESGGTSTGSTEASESTSAGIPTSRQTEETETFKEGGRTKVRRRIVREEVVDADDDQNASP